MKQDFPQHLKEPLVWTPPFKLNTFRTKDATGRRRSRSWWWEEVDVPSRPIVSSQESVAAKDNSWPWTTQVARISRSNQKAPERIRALLLGEHNRIIQLCWWIPPTWQVHNGSEFFPWHSIMLTECLEAPIAFLPSESVPPWLTTRVPVIFFLQPTIQSFPISAPHPLILCIWQCNQIALMW